MKNYYKYYLKLNMSRDRNIIHIYVYFRRRHSCQIVPNTLSARRVVRRNISLYRSWGRCCTLVFVIICLAFSRTPAKPTSRLLAINTVRNGTIYKTEHLTTAPAFSLSRAKFPSRRFLFLLFVLR